MFARMMKSAAIGVAAASALVAVGATAPVAMAGTMTTTQSASIHTTTPPNMPREKKVPEGTASGVAVAAPAKNPREKNITTGDSDDATAGKTNVKTVPIGNNALVGSGLNGRGPVGKS